MIDICEERQEDLQKIRQVIVAAGGGDPKDRAADLVELLRDRNKALISLVAVSGNKVVGHIMFSPVTVALAPMNFRGIALAPLMVLPDFQRQGIGSMLVHEGLRKSTKAEYDMVVVLGSSRYYPRFGFSRASNYGLGNEYNTDENFMALEELIETFLILKPRRVSD